MHVERWHACIHLSHQAKLVWRTTSTPCCRLCCLFECHHRSARCLRPDPLRLWTVAGFDSTAAATVVVSTTTVAASYWAFTFGVAALSLASLCFVERGMTGVMQELAVLLFVGANIVIGSIALGTIRLLLRGKLLPLAATGDRRQRYGR